MNLFIGRTNADDLSNKFGGRWITTCFKGVGGPIKSCGFVHFGVEQVYQNQTFNSEHHVPCDELIASVMSEVSKNFRKFFPNNNDSDARYVDELMKSILAMNYRKVFFTAVIKYTKDLKTAAFDIGEPSTSTVRAQANKWETELSESEEEEGLEDESDEYDSDNDHGYVYLDFDGIKVKSYYDLDKEALAEKKQELRQAQAYEKSTGIDMKEARWSFCIAEIKLLNLLNVDGFFLKGSGIDKFVHIDKAIGKLTVINNRQCLTVVPLKYIDATFPELKEFEIEFGRLHGDFSTLKPLFFRNCKLGFFIIIIFASFASKIIYKLGFIFAQFIVFILAEFSELFFSFCSGKIDYSQLPRYDGLVTILADELVRWKAEGFGNRWSLQWFRSQFAWHHFEVQATENVYR